MVYGKCVKEKFDYRRVRDCLVSAGNLDRFTRNPAGYENSRHGSYCSEYIFPGKG